MNKISSGQLAALLVLSRMFAEATRFPLSPSDYNMQRFTAVFAAKIILVLMYIPIILFARKNPGESVISAAVRKNKTLAWTVGVLFILFILVSEIITMCKLQFYASSTIFSEAPTVLLVVLLELVCGYAVFKGVQAIARTGVVVAAVLAVFITAVGFSVWQYAAFTFLYPVLVEDGGSFVNEVILQLGLNVELLIVPVLIGEVRSRPQQAVYWYIPVILILIELMHFLGTVVLGPYLSQVDFPFFLLSALSDIGLFQRLDGIDVAVWILACIIKRAMFTLCIKIIVTKLLGEKAGRIAAYGSLAAVGALTLFVSANNQVLDIFRQINRTLLPLIICGVLIPAVLLFGRSRNEKKAKGGENS